MRVESYEVKAKRLRKAGWRTVPKRYYMPRSGVGKVTPTVIQWTHYNAYGSFDVVDALFRLKVAGINPNTGVMR